MSAVVNYLRLATNVLAEPLALTGGGGSLCLYNPDPTHQAVATKTTCNTGASSVIRGLLAVASRSWLEALLFEVSSLGRAGAKPHTTEFYAFRGILCIIYIYSK